MKRGINLNYFYKILLLVFVQIAFLLSTSLMADGVMTTKGKISGKSNKAKTISLALSDGSHLTVKFNDQTKYKNAKSSRYLRLKDAIKVQYKEVKGEKIALVVERLLAKIPAGTSRISTSELVKLFQSGKKFTLIDARPPAMYEQSHIPGAVSIPYSKLTKVGAKLLPFPKDEILVFYCGGDT